MRELEVDRLRKNIITYIFITMILLSALAIFTVSFKAHKTQQKNEQRYSKQIDNSIKQIMKHFLDHYTLVTDRIIRKTNFLEFLQNRDKEAMQRLVDAEFQAIRHGDNINLMQVHLSDGNPFVSAYETKKDHFNLSKHRLMIDHSNQKHTVITGYDADEYGTSYRLIQPVFNQDGKYIGAFEVGLSLNFILKSIGEINSFLGFVFVREHDTHNHKSIGGYELKSEIDGSLKDLFVSLQKLNKLDGNLIFDVGKNRYITHLLVLRNFDATESVKFIFLQDITNAENFLSSSMYKLFGIIFLILSFLAFLIYRRISSYQDDVSAIYLEQLVELKESEQRYQLEKNKVEINEKYLEAVFNIVPHIMITTNGEEIDKANQQMLEFFEYESLEAFKDKHHCICDFFIEELSYLGKMHDDISWLDYILKYPQKLHKVSMKKKDKHYRFIVKAQQIIFDKEKRFVVTFNDITEIEDLRVRLDIAVNGTNDGLWDWSLESDTIYLSPQWKKQLGYEDNELKNSVESWHNAIHPDDRDHVIESYQQSIEKKIALYENIYRLKHKDGSWVWILDRAKIIFDKNSKAIRIGGFHTDITKQKELELELLKSQEQFTQFMEHIPAHILIKEEGHIVYANSSATQSFHQESIIGKTAEELLPSEMAKEVSIYEDKALQDGFSDNVIVLEVEKKQILRNLNFSMNYNSKKVIGIVVLDITKEYNANKEISKLLSAFERSDISVLITDKDATIEYVNPKWCEITGYTKEELLGANPRIVKSQFNDSQLYIEMWDLISNGQVWSGEIRNRAKDGSEFWEESTIVPSFDKNGEVDGYIAFKSEISEKIFLKEELHHKDEIMIAQSRHAAMGEMISMIAHQWRQPISVIAMDVNNILVDVELDMVEKEELLQTAKDINLQVAELSKTIDDFREFFKPNKEIEDIRLKQVIDDALKIIGKSLENNNILMKLDLDESIEIKTFSRELMQVLINLLKNSKEALLDNGIEKREIFLKSMQDKEKIYIIVEDNAGGIDTKIINKIFDPYFTTKGEKNGTGLGLYMSKTIIEKHLKGTVEVINIKDGVSFSITLPLDLERN